MAERTLEAEAGKVMRLSLDEVRRCIALLEAIVADRALLADVPAADRQALMIAAGRVSRPARHEARRLVKEFRRRKKQQLQEDDREARATTGIRAARQAAVFVAPAPARIAAPAEAASARARASAAQDLLRLQGRLHPAALLLRRDVPARAPSSTTRSASRPRRSTGGSAVITGARVKIGFQAALKMLRAGGAGHRHHALPPRRRAALRARARLRGVAGPAGDPRPRPAPRADASRSSRATSSSARPPRHPHQQRRQTVRRPPGFYAHLLDVRGARAVRSCRPSCARCCARTTTASPCARRAPQLAQPRGRRTPPASSPGAAAAGVGMHRLGARSRRSPTRTTTPTRRGDLFPDGRARRRPAAGRPARAQHLAADAGRGGRRRRCSRSSS